LEAGLVWLLVYHPAAHMMQDTVPAAFAKWPGLHHSHCLASDEWLVGPTSVGLDIFPAVHNKQLDSWADGW
jgi:hypothetical protein